MRSFFLNLLNTLDKLTGLKQMEKLQSSANPIKEINELLDILCKTCNQFDYIPEKEMQAILTEAIYTDDFIGLNGRWVFKHLSQKGGRWFRPKSVTQDDTSAPSMSIELSEEEKELVERIKGAETESEKLRIFKESILGKATGLKIETGGSKLKEKIYMLDSSTQVYVPEDPATVTMRTSILEKAKAKYKDIYGLTLRFYNIEGFDIYAASKEDAEEIYIEALS